MAANKRAVDPATEWGKAIYATRVARGFSSKRMGEICGLKSPGQVSKFEEGANTPSLLHLLRIGALAEGKARRTIVEACREKVLVTEWAPQIRGVLVEVAE